MQELLKMRPENVKFIICTILLISFLQLSLALPVAAEANSSAPNLLDQFIIATMRILFAIGIIVSIIAFTMIALVSILPWWVQILTVPVVLVIFYFTSKYLLNALIKMRIQSKIGNALSKRRIPIKIGYESQVIDKAVVVKRKVPDLSYVFSPGFVISWLRGDVENGKISWQLFAMGALITLGTSIGIIILLFGHLNI